MNTSRVDRSRAPPPLDRCARLHGGVEIGEVSQQLGDRPDEGHVVGREVVEGREITEDGAGGRRLHRHAGEQLVDHRLPRPLGDIGQPPRRAVVGRQPPARAERDTPAGQPLDVLDGPAESPPYGLELGEAQHLGERGPTRGHLEHGLQCPHERVLGGERPVADTHGHGQIAALKDRNHQGGERLEVGAQHEHLGGMQGRVGNEGVPQRIAQRLELAHPTVAGVHLERAVGAGQSRHLGGSGVGANGVLDRTEQRG